MADRRAELAAAFARIVGGDKFLRDFLKRDGLKQADALKYAERLGDAASAALLEVLGPDALADETLRREAAETLLLPLLKRNFDAIQTAASAVQKAIDRAAGIGLNAVSAKYPADRADGLAEKFTTAKDADTARSWLGEPVVNFHEHAHDAWVRENADFRYKAGLSPKIVRTGHAGMCPWCAGLVGTYEYESVRHGSDVFRRHKHCHCTVTFVNGRERQNVWSKKRWEDSPDVLERRKAIMPPKATAEELERRRTAGRNFRPAAGETDAQRIMRNRIETGQYSLKLSRQEYEKHVEGTPAYKNAVKTRGKEVSKLTISREEAQELIERYSGTGDPRIDSKGEVQNVEFCTADKVIGLYFDAGRKEWVDTKRFAVYHSKKGSHIVPVKPNIERGGTP